MSRSGAALSFSRFLWAICLLAAPGCATMQWSDASRHAVAADPSPAAPTLEPHDSAATQAKPSARAEDTLAAVEAFLDRTQAYASTVSPEQQRASTPAVAPARIPSGSVEATQVHASSRAAVTSAYARTAADTGMIPEVVIPSAPALPVLEALTVREKREGAPTPAQPRPQPRSQAVTARTTNGPLDLGACTEPPSPDAILEEMQRRAESSPGVAAEWSLRMAQLALFRDEEATAVGADLPQSARSLMVGLTEAAVAIRRAIQDPALDGAEALGRVDELRGVLADRADPVVSNVALCRKVGTFGVYDEIDPTSMVAGRAVQAIVYCEVRNLRSERSPEGRFRTRLATRLEVLTAEGDSVWLHEEPEILDECRSRRTDFFVAQRMTLPPTLSAGDYVLKVQVEDKLSGRAHEASTPLSIHSKLTAASSYPAP